MFIAVRSTLNTAKEFAQEYANLNLKSLAIKKVVYGKHREHIEFHIVDPYDIMPNCEHLCVMINPIVKPKKPFFIPQQNEIETGNTTDSGTGTP